MTEVAEAANPATAGKPSRSGRLWMIIVGAILLCGAAAGGSWYFFAGRHVDKEAHIPPKPLPSYLDLKPFVVTVASNSGQMRFVQLGASLQITSAGAGEKITAVLPRIQDGMRQTMLTFKADDLTTPEGINRVRREMTKHLNLVLSEVLGPERFKEAAGNEPELVQNIYFTTLVVE